MQSNAQPIEVQNNETASRFEVRLDGQTAMLTYQRRGDKLALTHTEVPPAFEGRGVGSALARAGLDYAREHGLTVTPACGFVASYVQRHPEYQDLLPTARRATASREQK